MRVLIFGLVAGLAAASQAQTVWYNGAGDGVNVFNSMSGTSFLGHDYMVFEDFNWNSASAAGMIMATTSSSGNYSQVKWEIRQGMDLATQSQGLLIASGTSTASLSFLGTDSSGSALNAMTANIGSVNLTNGGTYWLGLAVVVTNPTTFFAGVVETKGTGGVGSPRGNVNSMSRYDSSGLFLNTAWNGDGHDASMGIGTVPEPATLAVLGLGALSLVRRRRR